MSVSDGGARRFRLNVVGGFALLDDQRPIALKSKKAQAMVAFLALSGAPSQTREKLASLLWSDRPSEQARASLRQTLSDIKQALKGGADELFLIGRQDVEIRVQRLSADLKEIQERGVGGIDLGEGFDWSGLADNILLGLDDVDPSFGDWLASFKQQYVDRLVRTLERKIDEAKDDATVRRFATTLHLVDPVNEYAYRRLMETDEHRGDIGSALKRYQTLWELLDSEYGTEPSPMTQALAVRLKSLELDDQRPATAGDISRRPTILIGDFVIAPEVQGHSHLVRGFRHDLIATLAPFREWTIVEPTTEFEEWTEGDCFLLSGLTYPAPQCVRIVMTLKDTRSGRVVWSGRATLAIDNWFDLCEQTVRRIAAAVNVQIAADRLERLDARPNVSLPLYERWLMAQDLLFGWGPEKDVKAEEVLRSILKEAPHFNRARMGLAQLLNGRPLVFPGSPRDPAVAEDAIAHARIAVDADPLDAQAHLCLGWSYLMASRHRDAEPLLRNACDLNPTHPLTLASAADALTLCGELDFALELVESSLELDYGVSSLIWSYRVSVFLFNSQPDRALEAANRGSEANPLTGGYRAVAMAALGREDEARDAWHRYAADVAQRWRGDGPADDEAVANWFFGAPPVGPIEMRERLGRWLTGAGAQLTDRAA